MRSDPPVISVAVEGDVDEAVALKLVRSVGAKVGRVFPSRGKEGLRKKAPGYNKAARHAPWFVLVDLDREERCAPLLVSQWVERAEQQMCFRVAVRAVEAWLLADAGAMASFLSVAFSKIPREPETLEDPKRFLVNLARASRRPQVKRDLLPEPDSGRPVGPGYVGRMTEFAMGHWRPEAAAERSPSLRRALDCLRRLVERVPS